MTNEELQKEMIAAMKAKDKVRLSIIRQVKAEVKNIEVNERRDVTEEDVNSMIKRLIKQTSETLEMSIKAGTDQERTDNLTEQVKILESLLPAQVSGEELEALIEQVIAELGATSKKQMGQVMGALCVEIAMDTTYQFLKRSSQTTVSVALAGGMVAALLSMSIYLYLRWQRMAEARQQVLLQDAVVAADAANQAKSTFLFNMSHDIRTPHERHHRLCRSGGEAPAGAGAAAGLPEEHSGQRRENALHH